MNRISSAVPENALLLESKGRKHQVYIWEANVTTITGESVRGSAYKAFVNSEIRESGHEACTPNDQAVRLTNEYEKVRSVNLISRGYLATE